MKNQPRSSSTLSGSTVATLRPVHRVRACLIGIVLGTSGLILVPHLADAASPCGTGTLTTPKTCMYSSTDSEQTFTVPAGVTSVTVVAIGGAGGPGISTGTGGFGAACERPASDFPGCHLVRRGGEQRRSRRRCLLQRRWQLGYNRRHLRQRWWGERCTDRVDDRFSDDFGLAVAGRWWWWWRRRRRA